MFQKRARPTAGRKQQLDDDEEGSEPEIITTQKKKKRADRLVTSSSRKTDAERDWRLGDVAISGLTASGDVVTDGGQEKSIFCVSEADPAVSSDHRAVLERNQKIHEKLKSGELEAGIYRGQGGYKQYMEKSEGAISRGKSNGLMGQIRANDGNVRRICRFDYWGTTGDGGVCKDYKETGYCGYGDTCIYMHDRSDYKSGWQIEQEFEEREKMKRDKMERKMARKLEDPNATSESEADNESDSDEDGMPPDCQLCRDDWADCETEPVVTQCKHYFCEKCAMEHFQESRKCAVCNAATNGIFNNASSIMEKMAAKREAKIKTRAQAKRQSFAHNVPYQAAA